MPGIVLEEVSLLILKSKLVLDQFMVSLPYVLTVRWVSARAICVLKWVRWSWIESIQLLWHLHLWSVVLREQDDSTRFIFISFNQLYLHHFGLLCYLFLHVLLLIGGCLVHVYLFVKICWGLYLSFLPQNLKLSFLDLHLFFVNSNREASLVEFTIFQSFDRFTNFGNLLFRLTLDHWD